MPLPISEEDLLAYVDGQLDVARRVEVEAYLQQHPALAARVMQDMRQRDEVRLFLTTDPATEVRPVAAPPAIVPPAPTRRTRPRLRAAAAAAVFIGLGWTAHELFGDILADPAAAAHTVPGFARDAAGAYRSAMAGDPALPSRPPREAAHLARLASQGAGGTLVLPTVPHELHATATRVVPWSGGAAVQVDYATDDSRRVTLFAAEEDRFAVTAPAVASVDNLPVVYWRQGYHAYALAGSVPLADLLSVAETAQSAWY